MTDKTYCYVVKCYNEWCDGPETWKICDEKPIGPQKCPTCGWTALPKDGIHKMSTLTMDEILDWATESVRT